MLALCVGVGRLARAGELAVRAPYRLDDQARDVLQLCLPDNSGVQVGDPAIIVRDGAVLGAGQVVTLSGVDAVCQLSWIELALPETGIVWVVATKRAADFSNALPPMVEAEDSTRWRTSIREVVGESPSGIIRLHDSADGPAGVGDRLDIYRGSAHLGFARIIRIQSGLMEAEQVEAMSNGPASAGDLVVRREPSGGAHPGPGHIFRLEGSYALISLGEADGVRLGQVLVGRSVDGGSVRLRVERAYPDHCGAKIIPDTNGAMGTMARGAAVWLGQLGSVLVGISPNKWRETGVAGFFWIRDPPVEPPLKLGDFVVREKGSREVGVIIEVGSGPVLGYTPGIWHLWGPGEPNDGRNSERQTTADTGLGQSATTAPVK